jgi:ERCC4-related helicase
MIREMAETPFSDPKEHYIKQLLKRLPDSSKTIIICETKFEAQLLSERLSKDGLPALWYAGRSVKKSIGLDKHLEAFRRGDVRVLCGTSAVETGHDIPEVSYILRLSPVTSTTKNAQGRGRAARQEGKKGEYITISIDDPDRDNTEMPKFYRAKQRLWSMERNRRKQE